MLESRQTPGSAPRRAAVARGPILLITAAGLLLGCGDRGAPAGDAAATSGGGGGGGGAGAAAPGCAPGELMTGSGCEPAGIPPEACGAGFSPGDRACAPVLPPAPCPAGSMAVPGETTCREVGPCGDGTWGDIPLEEGAQFVHGAYPGGDSDGTRERPWTTLGEGVRAAAPGAVVAIAAGTYPEDVRLEQPVKLWGRCPALVEITGAGPETEAAVSIGAGADEAEVRGVAVRSAGQGIAISGALRVVIDGVWVDGTGAQGVLARDAEGPAQVTVRGSLIERARHVGVHSAGVELVVESSVVRGTLATSAFRGTGAGANRGASGAPGSLTVRASVIEQSQGTGLYLIASGATVEDSVIRDTVGVDADAAGMGVFAIRSSLGQPSQLAITRSVVEGNEDAGIWVQGSSAVLEDTVVRDTRPYPPKLDTGGGIYLVADIEGELRSEAALRRVVVERSRGRGVGILGSDVSLEGLIVRDTLPRDKDRKNGIGLAIASAGALPGAVTARGAVIEGSRALGVFIEGAEVTLEGVAIRRTLPQAADDRFGRGVEVQSLGPLTGLGKLVLRASLIEDSAESGLVVFGSAAVLADTTIRGTRRSADGLLGNGVTVVRDTSDAEAELTGVRVEASEGAAVTSFGGSVSLQRSTMECNFIDLQVATELDREGLITDRGDNRCGCAGASIPCVTKREKLTPPEPLPPL